MDDEKYKVLLVDDSPDDRFFMRLALERSPQFIVVGEARDGQEAIDYLKGPGEFPDIMLLDLKMPGKNGFDVLQWIRSEKMDSLIVAVLSGSWLAEDIAHSVALGAHAYFKKTSHREEQDRMIAEIEALLKRNG